MKLVSLIIPAYNEVDSIRTTVDQAVDYFSGRGIASELIVAADGNDGTREAALEVAQAHRHLATRIHVIGSPERRGKGHAVREAVRFTVRPRVAESASRRVMRLHRRWCDRHPADTRGAGSMNRSST